MSFKQRLETRYKIKAEDEENAQSEPSTPTPSGEPQPKPKADKPGEADTQPGSAHPENWQTDLQTGKSAEEIRQDAMALSGILMSWQEQVLRAQEYFDLLTANQDKYLHLYNPILIKGLSREKLETMAKICQKFARLATIV